MGIGELGHYRVIKKLGEGGMGQVLLAEDTRLKRRVALKVLPRAFASDPSRVERFQREAEVVAALNHPNIVTLYSVEEADGAPFLTMELVDGQKLDTMIPPGGLPLPQIFDVGIAIADALAAAHESGVVHRDLKPANVMLDSRGQVKVLDFGLAKLVGGESVDTDSAAETRDMSLTGQGALLGTVPYMSPEQLEGKPVDLRTDIFSLGVVLYQMCTGQRPFGGETSAALVSSIMRDAPRPTIELRPDVPRALSRLIDHCLQKKVADRVQTAPDVGNGLREVQSEKAPTPRRSISRLLPVVAVVVAVLALLLIADVAGLRSRWLGGGAPVATPAAAGVGKLVVLPLEDFSSGDDQAWFAAGMHEALLTALQQIEGLRVISRTSAMHYRGTEKRIPEIAAELGVQWVVEGSVVRAGDRIRISAQLIDGSADEQEWAGQYEQDAQDILALQNEVARVIADEVQALVTPEEERRLASAPRVELDAYRSYVLGRDHFERFTPADYRRAVELFETAIARDPEFAPAHAALAVAYGFAVEYAWTSRGEAAPLAERAAEAALRLDPDSGETHHALASVQFHMRRDFAAAERSFRQALLRTSNAPIHHAFGWMLSLIGRHDEAIAELERAVELDPRSPTMHGDLGWWLFGGRRYDRALAEARSALALDDSYAEAHWLLAAIHAQQGDFDLAFEELDRYELLYGEPVYWFRGYIEGKAGRRSDALESLGKLERLIELGRAEPILQAQIYVGLGDHERVIEVVESAPGAALVWFHPYGWPEYEPLFAEPRFLRALARLGLPTPAGQEPIP